MRILLLAIALLPSAALARDPTPAPAAEPLIAAPAAPLVLSSDKPVCQNPRAQLVDGKAQPARPQSLSQMPKANLYYTVQRLENGCDKPVLVNGLQR